MDAAVRAVTWEVRVFGGGLTGRKRSAAVRQSEHQETRSCVWLLNGRLDAFIPAEWVKWPPGLFDSFEWLTCWLLWTVKTRNEDFVIRWHIFYVLSFQPDFQAQWPFHYHSIIQCRNFPSEKELIDWQIRLPSHFSVIVHRTMQNERTANYSWPPPSYSAVQRTFRTAAPHSCNSLLSLMLHP